MACRKVNLKGNHIRGKAVECIGQLLRQNKTLERYVARKIYIAHTTLEHRAGTM